jgi:hypothetical protein
MLFSIMFISCEILPEDEPLAIGVHYGGGVIFYLDASAEHGLIVSTREWDKDWSTNNTNIGNTSTDFGTGESNTISIVNGIDPDDFCAASVCSIFENGDGENTFDDWYLPSKDELDLVYKNLYLLDPTILNMRTTYWSSSESSNNEAWEISFYSGRWYSMTKTSTVGVRAVRSF